ncbi:MAG: hypothetical protein IMZ64_07430 [Bacteroidetes bacterium]|nr:hypothetical protein [Bacteroidota bacterium]
MANLKESSSISVDIELKIVTTTNRDVVAKSSFKHRSGRELSKEKNVISIRLPQVSQEELNKRIAEAKSILEGGVKQAPYPRPTAAAPITTPPVIRKDGEKRVITSGEAKRTYIKKEQGRLRHEFSDQDDLAKII